MPGKSNKSLKKLFHSTLSFGKRSKGALTFAAQVCTGGLLPVLVNYGSCHERPMEALALLSRSWLVFFDHYIALGTSR